MLHYCWFQIHIDAHADDDSPEYVAEMPFFRYPDTNAEMSYFMQKNDVFVEVLRTHDLYQRVLWRSEISATFLYFMRR